MSYDDYLIGLQLQAEGCPFFALIQAAMRQADKYNLDKLSAAYPEIWEELQARYDAPGAVLPGERVQEAPLPQDDDLL